MLGTTALVRPTAQDTPECAAKEVPQAAHSSAAQALQGMPCQSTWGCKNQQGRFLTNFDDKLWKGTHEFNDKWSGRNALPNPSGEFRQHTRQQGTPAV